MAYISFRNVVKKYGENEVLKDITFDIEKYIYGLFKDMM